MVEPLFAYDLFHLFHDVFQSCAETNVLVTINGIPCRDAVSQLGNYVCYNYERVSTECCESCLAVKRSATGKSKSELSDLFPFVDWK